MVPHTRWWRFADTLLLHACLSRPVGICCSVTTCRYLLQCHGLSLFTVVSVGQVEADDSLYRVVAEACAVDTGSGAEAGKQTSLD